MFFNWKDYDITHMGYVEDWLDAEAIRMTGMDDGRKADYLILSATVVIFPNNTASQKAFERAGFAFDHAHPDGDAWYYLYRSENM